MASLFASTFLLAVAAVTQAQSPPSPAEISSSIATARAQIARYRLTPPQSGEDRCFDLKQIVRSLRAGRQAAEQAQWHSEMRRICAAAHRPTDL